MVKIDFSKYYGKTIGDVICEELKIDGFHYSDKHIFACVSKKTLITENELINLLDSITVGETSNTFNAVINNEMANSESNSGIYRLDTKYWTALNCIINNLNV